MRGRGFECARRPAGAMCQHIMGVAYSDVSLPLGQAATDDAPPPARGHERPVPRSWGDASRPDVIASWVDGGLSDIGQGCVRAKHQSNSLYAPLWDSRQLELGPSPC